MLEARQLVVKRGLREVLRGLTLTLRAGEVTVLFGRNGAGKTTLLRTLGLLGWADGGEILFRGRRVTPEDVAVRGHIGQVLHESFGYGALSALENLGFFSRLFGQAGEGALEALRRVGLAAFADEPVRTYSEGMRRRLDLARLLIIDTDVWLLDEPLAGLDTPGKDFAGDLVAEARQAGKAVLVVSHEPLPASVPVDHTFHLERGHVLPGRTGA